jgi:flagellar biosynthesis/type III secretory pathway protein FliH
MICATAKRRIRGQPRSSEPHDCDDPHCDRYGCVQHRCGYDDGYQRGYDDGYGAGFAAGEIAGFEAGYAAGAAAAGTSAA